MENMRNSLWVFLTRLSIGINSEKSGKFGKHLQNWFPCLSFLLTLLNNSIISYLMHFQLKNTELYYFSQFYCQIETINSQRGIITASLYKNKRLCHTRVFLSIDSWDKIIGFKKYFCFIPNFRQEKVLCLCNYLLRNVSVL